MKRIELPLYLKISPIYNKILQLTIAVVLIVIVLNIHFISDQKSQTKVHQHYQTVGQLQLTQLSDSASVYLQKNDRKSLIALAENVSQQDFIHDVTFYGVTGQVIVSSSNAIPIKQRLTAQDNAEFIGQTSFTGEIRTEKLLGYVRITLNDEFIKASLTQSNQELSEQARLLLILAGIIGFLLAKSFSKVNRPTLKVGKVKH